MEKMVCVVAGDNKINQLMGDFDINDSGTKIFAVPEYFNIEVSSSANDKAIIDKFKEAYEKLDKKVAAVFIIGNHIDQYIDKNVRSISDGQKWFLLIDLMRKHQTEPKPNEAVTK